jgi:DNA-binding NtrC family response regulator
MQGADAVQTLLVVDDEPNIAFSFEECLGSDRLRIISAGTARKGIAMIRAERPDVVILDVRLPDLSGLEAHEQIKEIDPRLPVIVITAHGKTETAIESMRRGAFDYLLKPVDVRQLRHVVGKALEVSRLNRVPAVVSEDEADGQAEPILGRSAAMQEVYKAIGRVAPQDVPVLILGESGTGKELVARALWHYSRRAERPFLAINCAALPEALLESELFGHEKGAFTGADARRIGKFEQVNGGTIFLDEIGDMAPATQAKALRLLQDQSFERLGGTQTVTTDVRVIAATNKDLEAMIGAGEFRGDLFYRLNGFVIRLPPLRERTDDIPLLAGHFLRVFSQELGKPTRSFAPEALALLGRHPWPGNVRELRSAIRFALLQTTGDVVTPDNLPSSCRAPGPHLAPAIAPAPAGGDLLGLVHDLLDTGENDLYERILAQVDRLVLAEVLAHCGGNQQKAAERLGISRTTLRAKLRALGLIAGPRAGVEDEP